MKDSFTAVSHMNMSEYSLGYCTNVHAGEDLDQYLASLERYAVGVKSMMPGGRGLSIGLWLSARTVSRPSNAPTLAAVVLLPLIWLFRS